MGILQVSDWSWLKKNPAIPTERCCVSKMMGPLWANFESFHSLPLSSWVFFSVFKLDSGLQFCQGTCWKHQSSAEVFSYCWIRPFNIRMNLTLQRHKTWFYLSSDWSMAEWWVTYISRPGHFRVVNCYPGAQSWMYDISYLSTVNNPLIHEHNEVVWYDMTWYDMTWYDMTQQGMIALWLWQDHLIWDDVICYDKKEISECEMTDDMIWWLTIPWIPYDASI